MPGPKAERIELSDEARRELERLVARHTTGQIKAQRGRIVLQAAAGKTNAAIARQLAVSVRMVRLWRRRWLALHDLSLADVSVSQRLDDRPRPGAPARLTADQVCQLEQLACQLPADSGRPISQWSGRELADELMRRGIVARISPRHAARLLKKGGCGRTGSVTT